MANPRIRELTPHDWQMASESKRGVWYHVTRLSCTCPGFSRWNHCKHRDWIEEQYGRPLIQFPKRPAIIEQVPDEAA